MGALGLEQRSIGKEKKALDVKHSRSLCDVKGIARSGWDYYTTDRPQLKYRVLHETPVRGIITDWQHAKHCLVVSSIKALSPHTLARSPARSAGDAISGASLRETVLLRTLSLVDHS